MQLESNNVQVEPPVAVAGPSSVNDCDQNDNEIWEHFDKKLSEKTRTCDHLHTKSSDDPFIAAVHTIAADADTDAADADTDAADADTDAADADTDAADADAADTDTTGDCCLCKERPCNIFYK
ncbi:aspartate and serine-rich protein-like [Cydia pomonella]|uniref:aspartate and serine-rich protein-like n=1 Tax=Cydia pomonella TaxID=82600 RepID=UPI002ADD393A|nr:aspartate and serine-rich protein-like [Cydia pomonella]